MTAMSGKHGNLGQAQQFESPASYPHPKDVKPAASELRWTGLRLIRATRQVHHGVQSVLTIAGLYNTLSIQDALPARKPAKGALVMVRLITFLRVGLPARRTCPALWTLSAVLRPDIDRPGKVCGQGSGVSLRCLQGPVRPPGRQCILQFPTLSQPDPKRGRRAAVQRSPGSDTAARPIPADLRECHHRPRRRRS